MHHTLGVAVLLGAACLPMVGSGPHAQSTPQQVSVKTTSLCVLQKKVAEGKHEAVRVYGTYGPGLDHAVLEDPSCPAEGTWVELALRSDENKEKLRKLLDRSERAYVLMEGEFYGPRYPTRTCLTPSETRTIRGGATSQHSKPSWLFV